MSEENFSEPSYISGINIFEWRFIVIYRHLLSKCSENAVLGQLEMVWCNCFLRHQPGKCFWLYCGSIFLIMEGLGYRISRGTEEIASGISMS